MDSTPEPAPRPAPRPKVAPRPAPRATKGNTSEPGSSTTSLSTQNASETEKASIPASSVEAIVGALVILNIGSGDADVIVRCIETEAQEKGWGAVDTLVEDCRALQSAGDDQLIVEVKESMSDFSSMCGRPIIPTPSSSQAPSGSAAPVPAPKPRPPPRPRQMSIPKETTDTNVTLQAPITPDHAITPTPVTPSGVSTDATPETQAPVPEQAKPESRDTSTTSLGGTGGRSATVVPAPRPRPKPRPVSVNLDEASNGKFVLNPAVSSPVEPAPRPAPRDKPELSARRYSSMENTATTASALLSPLHPPEENIHENGDVPPPKPPRRASRQSDGNLTVGGSAAGRSMSVPLGPNQPNLEETSEECKPVAAPRPAPRPRPFSYHEGVNKEKDALGVWSEQQAEKMSVSSERAEVSDTNVGGGGEMDGGGEKAEHQEGKEKEHGGEKAGTKKLKLGMGGLLKLVDWKNKAAKKAKSNAANHGKSDTM